MMTGVMGQALGTAWGAWVHDIRLTAGACRADTEDGGEAALELGARLVGDLQLAGALDDVLDLDGLDIGRHPHASRCEQLLG